MEYSWKMRRRRPAIWKGVVAGAAGGLVASWAMNAFSSLMTTVGKAGGNGHKKQKEENGHQRQEDPTMRTAEKISETVADAKLNNQQKEKGGAVVHFAFGGLMGAVYGAAAEFLPSVKSLAGLPYGAALFVGADEVALPVLGLSKMPTEYPLSKHFSGLGQHLVYGATMEFVRRAVRDRL